MPRTTRSDLYEALDSAERAMLYSDTDWSTNPAHAWLYGIIVGWGDDDWAPAKVCVQAWDAVASDHGWTPIQIAKVKRYRQAIFEFKRKVTQGSFDGKTFDHELDERRLGKQLFAVKKLMEDGQWRTLEEISAALGAPTHSVSARLRDLRKPKFGGRATDLLRRRRGDEKSGLHEYRYDPRREPKQMEWEL